MKKKINVFWTYRKAEVARMTPEQRLKRVMKDCITTAFEIGKVVGKGLAENPNEKRLIWFEDYSLRKMKIEATWSLRRARILPLGKRA